MNNNINESIAQQYYAYITPYELYRFVQDGYVELYRCRHSRFDELCNDYRYYMPLFTSANPQNQKYGQDILVDNDGSAISLAIKRESKFKVLKSKSEYVLVSNEKNIRLKDLTNKIFCIAADEDVAKKYANLKPQVGIEMKIFLS